MRITIKTLMKMRACYKQIQKFKAIFPKGAAITKKNIERALYLELDICWLVARLTDDAQYRRFAAAYRQAPTSADQEEILTHHLLLVARRHKEKLARRKANAAAARR